MVTYIGYEYIAGFEISVYDLLRMQDLQRLQQFVRHTPAQRP